MISEITANMNDVFFDLTATSKTNLKLCAPFVKSNIINKVLETKKESTKLSLITNCNMNYFCRKASDIDAIGSIIENQYPVINCQSLHAKIYIFDDNSAIVTSANLTYSGFNKNTEYGLLVQDEPINKQILQQFDSIVDETNENDYVNVSHINYIKTFIKNAPPSTPKDFSVETDEIFRIKTSVISENLSGWKKEVFNVINSIPKDMFTLKDLQAFIPHFKRLYPENNNIEAKIRQQLQFIRNLGLLKFEGNGVYKKLWQ